MYVPSKSPVHRVLLKRRTPVNRLIDEVARPPWVMDDGPPRFWPYSPNNSPSLLPDRAILFTSETTLSLSKDQNSDSLSDVLDTEGLRTYLSGYTTVNASLDDALQAANAPGLDQRKPVLLLGELANPYRLQDMKMGPLPLFTVRLEGVCTTWSDGLDPRETQPGVHHVTLARTPGWWETVHLGMATLDQLKLIRSWIENGVRGSWRPVKLGEGELRIEHDPLLEPPSAADIDWDGQHEVVKRSAPAPSGPSIDLGSVMALVHTRQGCYNNRGRLARCAHLQQRAFHEGLFRRGSSHRWDSVLTVQ